MGGMMQERYISQAEMVRVYGLSRQFLRKLADVQDFPKRVEFFGRYRKYVRADVEQWFKANEHNKDTAKVFADDDLSSEAEKKAVKDSKEA